MAIFEFLTGLLATLLKLVLWAAATLLGLALLGLALAGLLSWLLIQRLRGRNPSVTLAGRFQDLRRFGAGFGASGWRAQPPWPRRARQPAEADSPDLPRRRLQAGEVEDVPSRDLPADRPQP